MTNLELTDYFIQKFTNIPEEEWTTRHYVNTKGQKCALGHCGLRNHPIPMTEERIDGYKLLNLFELADLSVTLVNDDENHSRYQQPSPKQRILAALNDIRKTLV